MDTSKKRKRRGPTRDRKQPVTGDGESMIGDTEIEQVAESGQSERSEQTQKEIDSGVRPWRPLWWLPF